MNPAANPFSRTRLNRSTALVGAVLATILLVLPTSARQPASAPAPTPTMPTVTVPSFRLAKTIGVLTIEGEIDPVTFTSLERRIKRATQDGCDAIVLDINTPGGLLTTTLDICDMLKDRTVTPPNVVAWVNPRAYSAGSIISLACREIIIAPNGAMGDAAPINVVAGAVPVPMPAAERAKAESPILAEVIDSARRNHYDENLVQAFISVGIELWLIESKDTGDRVIVDANEYAIAFGELPPAQIPTVTPSGSIKRAIKPMTSNLGNPVAGLSPQELKEQIELQQTLPPTRERLDESSRGRWTLVGQVISGDRLLTLKAGEAQYYGLTAGVVRSDADLLQFFAATTIRRYDRTWSEGLVRFLIHPIVRIVLILLFVLSTFIAFFAPGLGVFETASIVSLLLLVGAPWLAGLAQWWDVLLIGIGLALIAVEVFLVPGLGIPGIAGALSLLVGLVGTFVTGDPWSSDGMAEMGVALVSIFTAVFAAGVGMWLISRKMHSIPVISKLMLKAELANDQGPPTLLEAMAPASGAGIDIGTLGIAVTDLRPSGRAVFDDRLYDVQTVGRFVTKGASVRVLRNAGMTLEVEEADS